MIQENSIITTVHSYKQFLSCNILTISFFQLDLDIYFYTSFKANP